MDSLVRVGNTIYGNGKVISQRMHGAWYRKIKARNGHEHETVSEEEGKKYDSMLDCLKMPLSQSELSMMDTIRSMVDTNPRLSPDDKKEMLEHIEEGIVIGLRRYGPYNPSSEIRNLRQKVREKARNVIVYSLMILMKDPNSAPTTSILIRQAMIIWSFSRW